MRLQYTYSYLVKQIYVWSEEMADRGRKKMKQKNVVFTKDGMKVGVKEVKDEDYAAAQQRCVNCPLLPPTCTHKHTPAPSYSGPTVPGTTANHSFPHSWLVKTWNASSFPAYKSRFWNKDEQARQKRMADEVKRAHLHSASTSASSHSTSTSTSASPSIRPQGARSLSGQGNLGVPSQTRSGRQRSVSPGAFPDD